MRVYRHEIVANSLSFTVPAAEFTRRNYGWTRLEVASRFLEELGIEVEGVRTMQVIPCGETYTIRIQDA